MLGSCLIERQAVKEAHFILEEMDFYQEANREVFKAVMWVARENDYSNVDVVTVGARLRESGKLDEVGGHEYLTSLIGAVATAEHAEYYARIIRGHALSRSISLAVREVYEEETPEATSKLSKLVMAKEENQGRRLFDLRTDLQPVIDKILDPNVNRIGSGFPNLDHALNKFEPGELITVGARPGGGKTAFMTRMCLNMAMDNEECLYITSEMRVPSLIRRILPMATRIESQHFRTRRAVGIAAPGQIEAGVKMIASLPIKMMDHGRITLKDIRGAVNRTGCKAVFVDYLQRCRLPSAEKESTAIYDFMAEFKEILLDTGAVGIIGCQLDRGRDKNPSEAPVMSEFRGSSGIESESDTCLMLWRPPDQKVLERTESLPPPEGQRRVQVSIRKAREAPADVFVDFDFDGKLVQFVESKVTGEGRRLE